MTNIFFSGLPRSGSTALKNLLNQNDALGGIVTNREIGTDKSLEYLQKIHKPKVIVMYRPILEVLASFIQLTKKYPVDNYIDKVMLENQFGALSYRSLDDARCDWLMRPYGDIELSLSSFKNTVIFPHVFHLVTYEDLCSKPIETIEKIYKFLEIEPYEHNFDSIPQHDNSSDKDVYGIPTLHTIRPQITKSSTKPEGVLSDYVIQKYSNAMDFFTKGWLQSRL